MSLNEHSPTFRRFMVPSSSG